MQTQFAPEALADPHIRELEGILRSCVHCGFCTATCPTYVTLGDERDSPRGRIYLIKDLLETGRKIEAEDVAPIDHCLSCLVLHDDLSLGRRLSPSGRSCARRDRGDLPPPARRPPACARSCVRLIASRAASAPRFGSPRSDASSSPRRPRCRASGRSSRRCWRSPRRASPAGPAERPGVYAAAASRAARGAAWRSLGGCAEAVLAPQIHAATIRLLNRAGIDVVIPKGEGCCGSLAHHMGEETRALAQARADIDAWTREIEGERPRGDRRHRVGLRRDDQGLWLHAARRSGLREEGRARRRARQGRRRKSRARSTSTSKAPRRLAVAYHAACSLQHGQKIVDAPKTLLRRAGFDVRSIPEGASVLRLGRDLQHPAARDRRARCATARSPTSPGSSPTSIAAGNIGCITQIGSATATPVVHTVELLDWASGGPAPAGLA